MKTNIKTAAENEARAWHQLVGASKGNRRRLQQQHHAAREQLADALELKGDDRVRAALIFRSMLASP